MEKVILVQLMPQYHFLCKVAEQRTSASWCSSGVKFPSKSSAGEPAAIVGTIKHADDGRNFPRKGKQQVADEFALSALAYDLRRAICFCGGVLKLIDLYHWTVMSKLRNIAELREEITIFAICGQIGTAFVH